MLYLTKYFEQISVEGIFLIVFVYFVLMFIWDTILMYQYIYIYIYYADISWERILIFLMYFILMFSWDTILICFNRYFWRKHMPLYKLCNLGLLWHLGATLALPILLRNASGIESYGTNGILWLKPFHWYYNFRSYKHPVRAWGNAKVAPPDGTVPIIIYSNYVQYFGFVLTRPI